MKFLNIIIIIRSSFRTEVGNDAEGTHLTLTKGGDYDIQILSMETVCYCKKNVQLFINY